MLDSGTMILLIALLASGICALCLYSVYANVIRHETTLHDLRNRVEMLSNQQALHLAEIAGEIPPDIVEDPIEVGEEIMDESVDSAPSDIPESLSVDQAAQSAEPVSSSTNAA